MQSNKRTLVQKSLDAKPRKVMRKNEFCEEILFAPGSGNARACKEDAVHCGRCLKHGGKLVKGHPINFDNSPTKRRGVPRITSNAATSLLRGRAPRIDAVPFSGLKFGMLLTSKQLGITNWIYNGKLKTVTGVLEESTVMGDEDNIGYTMRPLNMAEQELCREIFLMSLNPDDWDLVSNEYAHGVCTDEIVQV